MEEFTQNEEYADCCHCYERVPAGFGFWVGANAFLCQTCCHALAQFFIEEE